MLPRTLRMCQTALKHVVARPSGKIRRETVFSTGSCLRLCYSTTSLEPQKTAPSVDLANIEVLQKHSQEWWNPTGQFKPLHSMNHLRVPFIREGLIGAGAVKDVRENLKGLHLLEVGCGGGILTEALARIKANVTAIDPSGELIRVAKEHLTGNEDLSQHIDYQVDTIESHISKNSGKYDAVVVSEVIEHVNDQENFLKLCIDSVKPGGSIFVSTFNRTFLSYALGIVLVENIIKLVPKNTHEWEKFISPQETQKIFEKNNCSVISVNGLVYQPWSNSWRWIKSTDLTYIQHAVKH